MSLAESTLVYLQVPVKQLAWLLSDQACRLIVCGKGPAGAVAQQVVMQLQQQLTSLLPDQVCNNQAGLARLICCGQLATSFGQLYI